jgi:hypothetical protein
MRDDRPARGHRGGDVSLDLWAVLLLLAFLAWLGVKTEKRP